jgi:hypothetical protein
MSQNLKIEGGANPPEVTVAAIALIDVFERANNNQTGELFRTLAVMAVHFVDPTQVPLPQSFGEVGLVQPTGELARFLDGDGVLLENTRKAFELIANDDNVGQSDLAVFLAFVKEKYCQ